ncbi:hypothetical protein JOL62DRAFT_581921, partial [Phyllosticta paracitricarpa]
MHAGATPISAGPSSAWSGSTTCCLCGFRFLPRQVHSVAGPVQCMAVDRLSQRRPSTTLRWSKNDPTQPTQRPAGQRSCSSSSPISPTHLPCRHGKDPASNGWPRRRPIAWLARGETRRQSLACLLSFARRTALARLVLIPPCRASLCSLVDVTSSAQCPSLPCDRP